MSENYSPTGTSQALYPVNFSSNHAAAVEMTCNMNLNCINNQVAGVWPNHQIQNSQPPLPLFPPPQQPPPPSLPYPQENWYNGYSYHHQVNLHRLAPYQTYPPYHFPHYLSQYIPPTSFYSMNQVWQSEINVGSHNAGLGNMNAKQGPVKQWPEMSWKIVSNSIAAQRFGNNKKNLVNNNRKQSSLEVDPCKSSTSKLNTALVKAAVPNIGCAENGHVSKSCSNSNPSVNADAVKTSKTTLLVCVYCKKEGHRGRNCPIKPCYKCDKVGHRAKKCPESESASARNLITSITATDEWEDNFLKLQPSLTKCVTGANAIPRGSGRPMSTGKSIGDQSTLSSLSSTAPNIVANDSLNFLPNVIPRRSTDSDEESAQDDDVPSRKRQRSCDSLSFEKNVDDESMKFSNSIKSLPREEFEEIIMERDATIADLKRQLNHSNERVATLECQVNSLNVTKEDRRSVGLQVKLTENSTSDPQNNYQAPFIKIERIKKSSASSRNETSNQEDSHSLPTNVTSIFQTSTANCNISHVAVKTEKL